MRVRARLRALWRSPTVQDRLPPPLSATVQQRLTITVPFVLVVVFFAWLVLDSLQNLTRIRSIFGFCILLAVCYASSIQQSEIQWRPVIGGIFLKFALGFLILRWPPGSVGFQWIAEKVITFLNFSYNGTRYVYGFLASPPAICGMHEVFVFSNSTQQS